MSAPLSVSVVVATFNRGPLLRELLDDLAAQKTTTSFEVIVVDDGSEPPVVVEDASVRLIRRANGGPAAARHRGIAAARNDVIVIVDDDMHVGPEFVAEHAAAHEAGAHVVYGHIQPHERDAMPLFERFHQRSIDDLADRYRRGGTVEGRNLCTGNVSFRKRDYDSVGGFDLSLVRCEDRDIGIRLQRAGAKFAFAERAWSIHRSDHHRADAWLARNGIYGESDKAIADKHPGFPEASPWAFFAVLPFVTRPLLLGAALVPALGKRAAKWMYTAANALDHRGRAGAATVATSLSYALSYYGGVGRAYERKARVVLDALRVRRMLQSA